jgi:hypothetical protein
MNELSEPRTKDAILANLGLLQETVARMVSGFPTQQFFTKTGDAWSAADYFKHMLLSLKPFVKGVERTPEKLKAMFGEASQPSRSYHEVNAAYMKRLAEGIRAEDYEAVTPATFRLPEGTSDEKSTLVEVWNDAHTRLFRVIDAWTEADLDTVQIPHPALGMVTVREMLYFTLLHNTLHSRDIQQIVLAI